MVIQTTDGNPRFPLKEFPKMLLEILKFPCRSAALALTAILTGCTATSESIQLKKYVVPLELPSEASTSIRVFYVDEHWKVPETCHKLLVRPKYRSKGCLEWNAQEKEYWIVVPKPKDWNDYEALTILGHEVLHATGGVHE